MERNSRESFLNCAHRITPYWGASPLLHVTSPHTPSSSFFPVWLLNIDYPIMEKIILETKRTTEASCSMEPFEPLEMCVSFKFIAQGVLPLDVKWWRPAPVRSLHPTRCYLMGLVARCSIYLVCDQMFGRTQHETNDALLKMHIGTISYIISYSFLGLSLGKFHWAEG